MERPTTGGGKMGDHGSEERLTRLESRIARLEEDNTRLQRVKDAQEIQNVFSLHEYYHQAGRHADEMDAIWAQKTPGLAMEEAVLNGRYVGLEAVRGYYVDFFERFFQQGLEEMRKIYPGVDTEPGSSMPFGVQLLHTLTTPIIEVAEDRETAKAVWISPGYVTAPSGGRLQAFWHWDRYAIDFAREEAGWKIWHFWVGKDFSTPYETSWVEAAFDPTGIQLDSVPGFPKPNAPSQTHYSGYSPFRPARFVPVPPVPYRTFSETFSY
jgi:hypothetical protein